MNSIDNELTAKKKKRVEDYLFLTFDIDWVCDDVLDFCLELLSALKIKATFFVTHHTSLLEEIRKNGHELGIHPNINAEPSHSDNRTINGNLDKLMTIVPDATSVRCHGLTRSNKLSTIFRNLGLRLESNFFLPFEICRIESTFESPKGLLQAPYNFGDYYHCLLNRSPEMSSYFSSSNLKILNFHPIHLFLNTNDIKIYNSAKRFTKNFNKLKKYQNHADRGIFDFFEELIAQSIEMGFCFDLLKNLTSFPSNV